MRFSNSSINSRSSKLQKTPNFWLAFEEYKRGHSQKISDLAAEATVKAIKFSEAVVEGRVPGPNGEVVVNDLQLRQISARDILNLGHGKAIDRSMNLNATGTLEEALALITARKSLDGEK